MTLELSLNKPMVKSGLFDLLIQYSDHEAYISEEAFSWGVLAINPDMAVYPEGSQVQLDMAVLDKMGRMVCDAELELRIKNQESEIDDTLSTEDGTIQVTEGCYQSVTELPDYTASYQTGPVGVYELVLTANTRDGEFVITDSFEVDPQAQYYVKRQGPTRIFPLEKYEMVVEITPNREDSGGVYQIEEIVPADFEVVGLDGGRVEQVGAGGEQKIIWSKEFASGVSTTVSYRFDAPDISPALFLVGPLEIVGEWLESRQWQIASDTTLTAIQAAANWEADDTAYVDFTNPQSGGSPQTLSRALDDVDGDFGNMDTLLWKVTYFLSGTAGDDTYQLTVRIVNGGTILAAADSGGTYQEVSANVTSTTDVTTGPTGFSYVNTSASEATWNGASAELQQVHTKNTGWDGNYIRTDFTEFTGTYTIAAAGPTMDEVMRHGNWFNSSGVEQSFYWAQ